MWEDYQVIRAAKSDSRLPNNLRIFRNFRTLYGALRFPPRIEAMGKLLVERMRSYGPYIDLHLRYEKDMLAFSGCTHGLSSDEANELTLIRENTTHWKVKDIDSKEQRSKGYCPLTPKEVGMFLTGLGYPSNTPIYIAAGEIYGGDNHMAHLLSRFPLIMSKVKRALDVAEKLIRASPDELQHISGELVRAFEHVRCLDMTIEGEEESAEGNRKILIFVCKSQTVLVKLNVDNVKKSVKLNKPTRQPVRGNPSRARVEGLGLLANNTRSRVDPNP